MDPDRWREVDQILAAALELPTPRRSLFLDGACGSDDELRRQVDELLEADARSAVFLDRPLARLPPEPPEPPEAAATSFGPYRVLRVLNRSLMATVYLAERDDHLSGQLVAIKVLGQEHGEAELRSRFVQEQQILAQLRHPNIARLFDAGTTDDSRPYLVMEYVEGLAIDVYCRRRNLCMRPLLELFRRVCAAVQHAHQNLLVHRDLKPSNILVTEDGTPKLLDFGIAKSLHPERFGAGTTRHGLRPMTPRYASPEQVRGRRIDIQSDIYSLGVLLYELLTGHSPYLEIETGYQLEQAICEQEFEPASRRVERSRARLLQGDLDSILRKAMAKEPEHRYSTVERLSDDVRRHLEHRPVSARRPSFAYDMRKLVRRHKVPVMVTTALVLLVGLFVVALAVQNARILEEREVARMQSARAQHEQEKAQRAMEFMAGQLELANPTQTQGEEFDALQVLDAVAARARKQLGDQPEVQATLFLALGRVYTDLGRHATAAGLLEHAVALRREKLGPDDPLFVESLTQLALLRQFQGQDAEAIELLREALLVWESPAVDEPVDHMMALVHLAGSRRRLGQLEEAERHCRQAVEVIGDHPAVAQALGQLGLVLRAQGRYAEAEKTLVRATDLVVAAMGPKHPLVAQFQLRQVSVLNAAGRAREALPLLEQSSQALERMLEPGHPLRVEAQWQRGRYLELTGQPEQAIRHYREALSARQAQLGGNHPTVEESRRTLAALLGKVGREDEAKQLRTPLTSPAEAASRESSRVTVANPLERRADLAVEVVSSRQELDALEARYPDGHWRLHEATSKLGEALVRMGRFEEAEPLLVASYGGLVESLGRRHPATRQSLEHLIVLYEGWHRPDDVARYRELRIQGDR